MPSQISCPHCGAAMHFRDEHFGKACRCAMCRKSFRAPEQHGGRAAPLPDKPANAAPATPTEVTTAPGASRPAPVPVVAVAAPSKAAPAVGKKKLGIGLALVALFVFLGGGLLLLAGGGLGLVF